MPVASPKPCAKRGCPSLVQRGARFCQDHTRVPRRTPRPEGAIVYGGRWQAESRAFLQLPGNAWCKECGAMAREVDHIQPHRNEEALFWDQTNWQPLCKPCHSSKTAREDGGFGNQKREKKE
jgi:5-methylcytosine-specific restriction protein A